MNHAPAPDGPIDIHSHLLPAIDDGCTDFAESLACVQRLKQVGFVGSICTPHIWPAQFPLNTPVAIEGWTAQLAQHLQRAGIAYQLWPGAELRIFEGAVDWMKNYGVPTLAGSRLVLTDFWEEKWPPWIVETYQWLLTNRYRPVLAHPERMPAGESFQTGFATLLEMGVWLQGNLRCFTGEDGYLPDQNVRAFARQGQYHFMALDMHGLECLEGRLDGMQLMAQEFGSELLDKLTIDAPRRLIFGENTKVES